MECCHTSREIAEYTARQLNAFFPDGRAVTAEALHAPVLHALERVEFCFKHINRPSHSVNGVAKFDVLYSDHYCVYVYLVSNSVHRAEGDTNIASKLFYLNKALHGLNCMYDTRLPDIFWLVHPVSTVLGKAQYSNYMVVHQNCTVGSLRGEYPTLGEKLNMSAGSSIIGNCTVGENVILAPGVTVLRQHIPANTLVSQTNALTFKAITVQGVNKQFHIDTE